MHIAGKQFSLFLLMLLDGCYEPQSIWAECCEFPTRVLFFAKLVV